MEVYLDAVYARVQGGIKRILKYLNDGDIRWMEWGDEDIQIIHDHYFNEGPRYCAQLIGRPIGCIYQKAAHMKSLGLLQVPGK